MSAAWNKSLTFPYKLNLNTVAFAKCSLVQTNANVACTSATLIHVYFVREKDGSYRVYAT